jgi:RHS repeat-associated protein
MKKIFVIFMALMATSMLISAVVFGQDAGVPFDVHSTVWGGQVIERNDYYPYGGRHANSALSTDATNRWRFSGKEILTTADVGLLDFGARLYDDRLCRWTTQDPMSEKYYAFSPYNYCVGSPANLVELDGKEGIKYVDDNGQKTIETNT